MTKQNGCGNVSGSFSATFNNGEKPFSSQSITFTGERYEAVGEAPDHRKFGLSSLAQYADGDHTIAVDEWDKTNLWFALFGNWEDKWQESSGTIKLEVREGQKNIKGSFDMIITDGYPSPVTVKGEFVFIQA